jgi:adenine phosphoribosyltransferase
MSQSTSQQDATTAQVSGQPPAHPSRTTELASLKIRLRAALRQFPDFPSPGILFEDILPIFADPTLHEALIRSLELHIIDTYGEKPDVIVGLEARGFLFGPSLALRLGASFVPVRKQGKLPGPCETEVYEKEYGQDFFQMQADALKKGQKVVVVDDIIATGMVTPLFSFLSFFILFTSASTFYDTPALAFGGEGVRMARACNHRISD